MSKASPQENKEGRTKNDRTCENMGVRDQLILRETLEDVPQLLALKPLAMKRRVS